MTQDDELTIVRHTYAKQIVHAARATNPRLEVVLATLRREQFLFPGPCQLMRSPGGYQETPSDDPIYLHQDVPVALVPSKRLNNGQASFLTFLISLGRLQEDEHAVHIGTGTGYYYSAVISHRCSIERGHRRQLQCVLRENQHLRPALLIASPLRAMLPSPLDSHVSIRTPLPPILRSALKSTCVERSRSFL